MSASTRIRLTISRYGRLLALGSAIFGLLLIGSAAMMYMNPGKTEITQQTNQQSFSSEVSTVATVTNSTDLYNKGETLRNMPVYFFAASPNLTFQIQTTGPTGQEVRLSHRLILTVTGSRGGEVFFTSREVLASGKQNVTDGSLRTNTTVNVSAIKQRVNQKADDIGAVGTLSVSIKLSASFSSDAYSGNISTAVPLTLTPSGYWIDGDLSTSTTRSQTKTTIRKSRNFTAIGGLAALGVGLLAAAGVMATRYRSIDPVAVETELIRSRYDEWVSNGEIPTKSEKEYISTDSLEDLVDIAIDSGGRVIYDQNLEAYAVVEGDLVYYFTTEDADFTDWFDI